MENTKNKWAVKNLEGKHLETQRTAMIKGLEHSSGRFKTIGSNECERSCKRKGGIEAVALDQKRSELRTTIIMDYGIQLCVTVKISNTNNI